MTGVSLSIICQAIVRNDKEYLFEMDNPDMVGEDEAEENGNKMEEEDEEGEEEEED